MISETCVALNSIHIIFFFQKYFFILKLVFENLRKHNNLFDKLPDNEQ